MEAHPELKISQDDIRDHIKGLFMGGQEETEEMKERIDMIIGNLMQNQDQVKSIYDQLFEQRLISTFKNNVKIKEKELSYDEFVEMISKTYEK
jgi:trigger factor